MAYTKEQREAKKATLQVNNVEQTNKKPPIRTVPLNAFIRVYSNCFGYLGYESNKTGLHKEWDNFGSFNNISLEELIVMRNSHINFFKKNWIIIKGFVDEEFSELYSVEEILEYLQVKEYYKDSLCPNNIDEVFKLSAAEIEKRVPNMSSGVKASIMLRANELIMSGEIDSVKMIVALEKALNCELSKPI